MIIIIQENKGEFFLLFQQIVLYSKKYNQTSMFTTNFS